jgi:hypothetical protein
MDSILDMLEEPITENSLLIAKQLIGKNVRVYLIKRQDCESISCSAGL